MALVLIDEVHAIGEERGATLEVILTRMKAIARSSEVRAYDIGAWYDVLTMTDRAIQRVLGACMHLRRAENDNICAIVTV